MKIEPSQILLIAALVFFIWYLFRGRSVLADRVIYLVCAVVGIVLVIDPEMASQVARVLGIGRGVDLMIYLFIILGLFYSAATTSRIKRLENQITAVVRKSALEHPMQGKEAGDQDAPR
jgi:hypothetical protein